jgi:glucoamylase
VWGGSYWTASLQYRALRGGARLARQIGRGIDVADEYDHQASLVLDYMQVSPNWGPIVSPTNLWAVDILE